MGWSSPVFVGICRDRDRNGGRVSKWLDRSGGLGRVCGSLGQTISDTSDGCPPITGANIKWGLDGCMGR